MSATTAATVTKNTTAAVGSGAVSALLIPSDWPLFAAILLGLIVGTCASWVWSDQAGVPFHRRWLIWQLGTWGLIFVLVLYAQEAFGLTTRACMAAAATFAWLGRDGLARLRERYLDQIGKEKLDASEKVRLPGTDSAGPSSGKDSPE